MNYKLSVIIPVYNVENYLRKCLDSVINQTYKNLEIFLIDDGSTDCSGKICDEYAALDSRIVIIHQKNKGVSCARMAGWNVANGDLIAFVDSDDYIDENMFQGMIEFLEKHDVDIVMCKDISVSEHNGKECLRKWPKNNLIIDNDMALKYLSEDKIKSFFCNKIFKKELLVKEDFINQKFEDYLCMHKIFYRCKKVGLMDIAYYYYFRRVSGCITKSDSATYLFFYACKSRYSWFQKYYSKYAINALGRCALAGLNCLEKNYDEKINDEILLFMRKNLNNIWKVQFLSFKDKIKISKCILIDNHRKGKI